MRAEALLLTFTLGEIGSTRLHRNAYKEHHLPGADLLFHCEPNESVVYIMFFSQVTFVTQIGIAAFCTLPSNSLYVCLHASIASDIRVFGAYNTD